MEYISPVQEVSAPKAPIKNLNLNEKYIVPIEKKIYISEVARGIYVPKNIISKLRVPEISIHQKAKTNRRPQKHDLGNPGQKKPITTPN